MGYWNSAAKALTNLNTENYWSSSLPSFTLGRYSTTSSYAPILTFNQKFDWGFSSGTSYKFNYDFSYKPYTSFSTTPTYSTPTYSSFAPKPTTNTVKFGALTRTKAQNLYTPRTLSGGTKSEYANLSKAAAQRKAATDPRLESIAAGGKGWSISSVSFQNDIKFATVGTTKLLNQIVEEIRKTDKDFSLTVTSALGTRTSPHTAAGHYNIDNVKLDFGGQMSKSKAEKVAQQLMATGKFDFANPECDGKTYHIDAQFKKELLA